MLVVRRIAAIKSSHRPLTWDARDGFPFATTSNRERGNAEFQRRNGSTNRESAIRKAPNQRCPYLRPGRGVELRTVVNNIDQGGSQIGYGGGKH